MLDFAVELVAPNVLASGSMEGVVVLPLVLATGLSLASSAA